MKTARFLRRRSIIKGTLAASLYLWPVSKALSDIVDNVSRERQYDLRDFLIGDGYTNNDARFDALIEHMTANPGATYRGYSEDRYYITFSNRIIPSETNLKLEGAEFIWGGRIMGAGNIMTLADGVTFDALRIRVLQGSYFSRAIQIENNVRGDLIEIISDLQINNTGGTSLDGGLRLYGNNIRIGSIHIENVDRAIIAVGVNRTTENLYIGTIDVRSYVTALNIRNVRDVIVGNHQIRVRSPNALPDPGHNGILLGAVENVSFGPGYVRDAGEHGYRIGGSGANEIDSRNICFISPRSIGSGQCGFKVWRGSGQFPVVGLCVSDGMFIDCGNKGGALGFNDFGMMLQNVTDGIVEGCSVIAQDLNNCAYDGFYISGPSRLQLNGCSAYKAARNSLRISQWNDDHSSPQAVNTLRVSDFTGSEHGAEGIVVEAPSEAMRDIFVSNAHLIGGTKGIFWYGDAEQATQPCYFSAFLRGQRDINFDVPFSRNIRVVDLMKY